LKRRIPGPGSDEVVQLITFAVSSITRTASLLRRAEERLTPNCWILPQAD
jgi:hypothetical protein